MSARGCRVPRWALQLCCHCSSPSVRLLLFIYFLEDLPCSKSLLEGGWSGGDRIQLPAGVLAVICRTTSPPSYKSCSSKQGKAAGSQEALFLDSRTLTQFGQTWKAVIFPLLLTTWAFNPGPAMKVQLHRLGQPDTVSRLLHAPYPGFQGRYFNLGLAFQSAKYYFQAFTAPKQAELFPLLLPCGRGCFLMASARDGFVTQGPAAGSVAGNSIPWSLT